MSAVQPNFRTKRHQVAQACDSCRAHRIKCDSGRPCSNCRTRKKICTQAPTTQQSTPTLSSAQKEIDALRQKVHALEQELKNERESSRPHTSGVILAPTPPSAPVSLTSHRDGKRGDCSRGTYLRPPRSPHASWFGPSSLYDFVRRFGASLSAKVQQPVDGILPQPEGSEALLRNWPDASQSCPTGIQSAVKNLDASSEIYLNPTQEQYFINLFWESYHTCVFPILDENAFKEHHHALYKGGGERRPSALVDIVIALCMQSALSALPKGSQGTNLTQHQDPSLAGRWHYRRCQTLVQHELDSPTVSTLQCQLLSAVYQCGGSFHNLVDATVASALRTAYMLGLHLDVPPPGPPCPPPDDNDDDAGRQRQRRHILWWAVYMLDSKIGIKLGRPFMVRDTSSSMPPLPADDAHSARISGSPGFGPIGGGGGSGGGGGGGATWLSFNLQHVKLYVAVRRAHTALCETMDLDSGLVDLPSSPESLLLEAHAQLLQPHISALDDWAAAVPRELCTARRQARDPSMTTSTTTTTTTATTSHPFSADLSYGDSLDIDPFTPLWLRRQRVLLEAAWHYQMLGLCRHFVSFGSAPASASAAAAQTQTQGRRKEELADRCAAHAVALVRLAHQVLTTTTEMLSGWHEMFQWLWAAAMTLAGYLVASSSSSSSSCPSSSSPSSSSLAAAAAARDALPLAVAALQVFGAAFAIADDAARILTALLPRIDGLLSGAHTRMVVPGRGFCVNSAGRDPAMVGAAEIGSGSNDDGGVRLSNTLMGGMGEDSHMDLFGDEGMLGQELVDLALGVDFWGDVDMLWPAPGLSFD